MRLQAATGPESFDADDRTMFERAVETYLETCFRNKTAVRASELAMELRVTPPYLSRIAPEIVQTTIRDFLRTKQLLYASRLLGATSLAIEEIALRSGFGTAPTFYRACRKAFGTTPDDYRCRLRNDSKHNDEVPFDRTLHRPIATERLLCDETEERQ